jgi:nucleoside-diphosphate-sugar epimerase
MKILLTGVTGFIGKKLIQELSNKNFKLSVILRHKTDYLPGEIKQFVIGDFTKHADYSNALTDIDCVIHLAGKAHMIDKNKASVLDEFRLVNTNFTLSLARQAAAAGVNSFIFLSSIGVNGNQNTKPFFRVRYSQSSRALCYF